MTRMADAASVDVEPCESDEHDTTERFYDFEDRPRCTTCKNLWCWWHYNPGKINWTTLGEFSTSAETGCPGCILVSGIARVYDASLPLDTVIYDWFSPTQELSTWKLELKSDAALENPDIVCEMYSSGPGKWPFRKRIEPYPKLPEHTMSIASIAKLKEQLEICERHHQCVSHTLEWLPTRLLDVSCESVRLRESVPLGSRYMALSHCWAAHAEYTTTKANIAGRNQRIPFEEIPVTFQHAIALTRCLDIQYLWIDSLCIIQDDESDWQNESAQMASVFANAYATVGADLWIWQRASDRSLHKQLVDACFTSAEANFVDLPHPLDPNRTYRVYVKVRGTGSYIGESHEVGPLANRGWTFQERRLSSRFIWCWSTELVVDCNQAAQCFCGTEKAESHSWSKRSDSRDSAGWYHMVNGYSNLMLTYPKDVFPALSGVAKRYQQYQLGPYNTSYLAGLWAHSLVTGLLWFPATRAWHGVSRPDPWRAPTWSWASILTSSSHITTLLESLETETETHDNIEILEANVVPKGTDPTGELVSGYIKVRGKLVRAELGDFHPEYCGHCVKIPSTATGLQYGRQMELRLDYDTRIEGPYQVPDASEVKLLLVRTTIIERSDTWTFVLLLRRIESSDAEIYERIGIGICHDACNIVGCPRHDHPGREGIDQRREGHSNTDYSEELCLGGYQDSESRPNGTYGRPPEMESGPPELAIWRNAELATITIV